MLGRLLAIWLSLGMPLYCRGRQQNPAGWPGGTAAPSTAFSKQILPLLPGVNISYTGIQTEVEVCVYGFIYMHMYGYIYLYTTAA